MTDLVLIAHPDSEISPDWLELAKLEHRRVLRSSYAPRGTGYLIDLGAMAPHERQVLERWLREENAL